MEVTNRFNGLDLHNKNNKLWMEVHNIYRGRPKPSPQKRNATNELTERLYNSLRKEEKKSKEKGKDIPN